MPTKDEVTQALGSVLDPEINLDIVSLGLIERLEIDQGAIRLGLIMTSPACPMGDLLKRRAEDALMALAGGLHVEVELLDRPAWSAERISAEARKILGW
jgi:metal-sulfur cluster biosynthetic enzyme